MYRYHWYPGHNHYQDDEWPKYRAISSNAKSIRSELDVSIRSGSLLRGIREYQELFWAYRHQSKPMKKRGKTYLSVSHTVIVGSLGLTVVVVVGNAVPVLLSLSLDGSLLAGSNHWQIALRSLISQNFIAYKKDLPGFSSILTWNACPG